MIELQDLFAEELYTILPHPLLVVATISILMMIVMYKSKITWTTSLVLFLPISYLLFEMTGLSIVYYLTLMFSGGVIAIGFLQLLRPR